MHYFLEKEIIALPHEEHKSNINNENKPQTRKKIPMKRLHSALLLATVVATATVVTISALPVHGFSEPASRGGYCDHDKVKKKYLESKYTVAHTRDVGSNPLSIAFYGEFVACSATVFAADASLCSKCAGIGEQMPTFVAVDSAASSSIVQEVAVCNVSDMLTVKKQNYITALVQQAVDEIKAVLQVPNYLGGLKPSPAAGTKCGAFPGLRLPDAHATPLTGGEHFMLYLSAGPDSPKLKLQRNRTSVSGAAHPPPLARGAACGYTFGEERPITGHLHFTPAAITAEDPEVEYSDTKKAKDKMYVVHQIFHILGFSEPFFRQGRSTSGLYLGTRSTYTAGSLASGYDSWTGGESRRHMNTVNVQAKARAFFSCSTLAGAESHEAQQDSHWAKRVFADDVMAEPLPWDAGAPIISDVTLAFFHDTGFFNPVYGTRNHSLYGWQRGCDFPTKDCRNRMSVGANQNADWTEHCWDRRHAQCSADLRSGGPCNLIDYNQQVPSAALQYFERDAGSIVDMRKTGGTVLGDFCGMPAQDGFFPEDDNKALDASKTTTTSGGETTAIEGSRASAVHDSTAFFGECNDLSNFRSVEATQTLGNTYGARDTSDSRCFVGSVNRMGAEPRTPYREARCAMLVCAADPANGNARTVFMQLFNGTVVIKCPVLGGMVNIALYSEKYAGDVECPAAALCEERSGKLVRTVSPAPTVTEQIVDGAALSGEKACSTRLVCANKIKNAYYATSAAASDTAKKCSDLSRGVSSCFAGRCSSEQQTFFRDLGLEKNCSATGFADLATQQCADGVLGAADLCGLLKSVASARAVSTVMAAVSCLTLMCLTFAVMS